MRQRLTAFGSSRVTSDDPLFHDVQALSSKIATQGWDGLTGGHQGMMAAFSQGVRDGGGVVRGITLECFPTPPNNSLSEEVRAHSFFDRMQILIEQTDAYIVLPGGLGTLAELAMTWDLLAIQILDMRPIILYGEMWDSIIDTLKAELIMSVDMSNDHGFECLHICHSHDEVLSVLNSSNHVLKASQKP